MVIGLFLPKSMENWVLERDVSATNDKNGNNRRKLYNQNI